MNALKISSLGRLKKRIHHAIIATPVNRLQFRRNGLTPATRYFRRWRTVDLRSVCRARVTRCKLRDALARVPAVEAAAQESVKKNCWPRAVHPCLYCIHARVLLP